MKTNHAKTMHRLLGKPMVEHIYDTLKKCGISDIVFVVGHGHQEIEDYLGDKAAYALQMPQLGTGHAVMQAKSLEGIPGKTLIINGDCPLISVETYGKLLKEAEDKQLVLLTMVLDDPASYGRIIRDESGQVLRIVEKKDANEKELAVKEVNAGIYCVDNELLWRYLPEISNDNKQHEYYITDLIAIFNRHGHKVGALVAEDQGEMQGINNRQELAQATAWLSRKVNRQLQAEGVTLIDPERTLISPEVTVGMDTVIYPDVRIEGNTQIGENCTIEEGTVIINAKIGNGVHIIASRLVNCQISDDEEVFFQTVSEP